MEGKGCSVKLRYVQMEEKVGKASQHSFKFECEEKGFESWREGNEEFIML